MSAKLVAHTTGSVSDEKEGLDGEICVGYRQTTKKKMTKSMRI